VCDQDKLVEEFYGGRRICKVCLSLQRRERYASEPEYREQFKSRYRNARRAKKLMLWDYLATHPCVDCGEKNPMVLEFDHRERDGKVFELSEITRGHSVAKMWAEVAKCDVRCANCHRKKTYADFGWEVPYRDYDWKDVGSGYLYRAALYGPARSDQHAADSADRAREPAPGP